MSNLIREWDEHVIAGNRISRDLESFDGVMKIAELPDSKVALHANGETIYIDPVLPEEVMVVLKTIVTNQLVDIRTRKEVELKKHMNSWKPATINPDFEAAVKEMEQQGKTKPDLVEDEPPRPLTPDEILRGDIDTVRRLFEDPSVTVVEIAEKYHVSKTNVYDFARRNHFTRAKKYNGFLDSPRKERP